MNIYKNDTEIRNFLREYKQHNLVVQGHRNTQDGLYDIIFPQLELNYAIKNNKNRLESAQYLHACAWLPAISSFQEAINKGNFTT